MLRCPAHIRAKLKDEPLIVLFDSIPGDRSYELSLVKKFIMDEWSLKEAHRFPTRRVTVDSIPAFTPSMQPKQPNGWDCALYALTNIKKMFSW